MGRVSQLKLTKADKQILESYIPVINDLAKYLGGSFEIVLHSLEDYDHAVIAIVNGGHTGRTVGAPITDLALDMLDALSSGREVSPYFVKNKNGEPLKSTTIPIRGVSNRIIGLLCINMYLNTSLCDILDTLHPETGGYGSAGIALRAEENFATNAEDLIISTLEGLRSRVVADDSVLPSNRNKVIVEELYDKGLFKLKNAVVIVAEQLGVSRNTVYMHIRNRKKAMGPSSGSEEND